MRPIPDRLTPLECWPVHMTRQDKASEWYSRWPLCRVVKLSSFLRTSPSPITSHFMLFSFSSSASSCTCSSFSNVLTLYVAIFSRSPLVCSIKDALEWLNKRCTAQSTLCVGNKKGKTAKSQKKKKN